MEPTRTYLTISEAADRLGVDRRTVRNHLDDLGGYKKFGRWMVASDLLAQHLPPPESNPDQLTLSLGEAVG